MKKIQATKFKYFIGIDVSKSKLDVSVLIGAKQLFHKEISNEPSSIRSLVIELKTVAQFSIAKSVFGLEQTGIYTQHVLQTLKNIRANIVLEDAVYIRSSLGKLRGKYDKLDSHRIANYLYKHRSELRLWEQRRPIIENLAHLTTLRVRLITVQQTLKIPLKEQKTFTTPELFEEMSLLCSDSLLGLKQDILKVNDEIKRVIKADEKIKRLYDIITSVPCIGTVTATQIIITTNEFKDITDPKKFASYAGVAPFRKESGIVTSKAKVSHFANKHMKALLHICALSAISYSSDLRDYYLRKTLQEGKPKMAVINAVRFKLLLRIFACLKQDRIYC